MQANPSFQSAAPWYRHRWPWFLMIGPALVLVAGAITTWLAMSRPDAMVVGDYYKQGKAINQELRRDREASRLGLVFDAAYDARRGYLGGSLRSHGEPVRAPFHIRLAHPTQPERDRVLEALPDGQGRFSAQAPGLEPTHWQVVVEGGARDWRLEGSWNRARQAAFRVAADPAPPTVSLRVFRRGGKLLSFGRASPGIVRPDAARECEHEDLAHHPGLLLPGGGSQPGGGCAAGSEAAHGGV